MPVALEDLEALAGSAVATAVARVVVVVAEGAAAVGNWAEAVKVAEGVVVVRFSAPVAVVVAKETAVALVTSMAAEV